MRVRINGDDKSFDEPPASVEALIETLGLDPRRVAVEVNGRVVRRSERPSHPLKDGDALEIVTLVGGG